MQNEYPQLINYLINRFNDPPFSVSIHSKMFKRENESVRNKSLKSIVVGTFLTFIHSLLALLNYF